MANYKGHLVGGVVAYGIMLIPLSAYLTSWATLVEWLGFTLLGCLFPDIDIKSKGQKYFYRIIFAAFMMLLLQNKLAILSCCSIISLVPMLVRHRGLFHQLWLVISLPLIFWVIMSALIPKCYQMPLFYDTLFFIAGAVSHLWLDFGWRGLLKQMMQA